MTKKWTKVKGHNSEVDWKQIVCLSKQIFDIKYIINSLYKFFIDTAACKSFITIESQLYSINIWVIIYKINSICILYTEYELFILQ